MGAQGVLVGGCQLQRKSNGFNQGRFARAAPTDQGVEVGRKSELQIFEIAAPHHDAFDTRIVGGVDFMAEAHARFRVAAGELKRFQCWCSHLHPGTRPRIVHVRREAYILAVNERDGACALVLRVLIPENLLDFGSSGMVAMSAGICAARTWSQALQICVRPPPSWFSRSKPLAPVIWAAYQKPPCLSTRSAMAKTPSEEGAVFCAPAGNSKLPRY